MSMDKAIEHGKEHRKPYRGSKAIDCTCRNHGTCEWCKENRMIHSIRENERTLDELKEYQQNNDIEDFQNF